ncbi:MAG: hypothetical protein LBH04_06385 [Tannerellaceae bacterium]|jgi:hypothetical protein|nr:hypothetical protein [Tannerellaceae bacterium]
MKTQPAIKNYFFGKAYGDLKNTISESFTRNTDNAKDFFDKADGATLPSFYWGLSIATYVFGTAVFLFCSAFHIVFLSLVTIIIYLCFSFIWLLDAGYRKYQKIFTACPHCYTKSILPVYHCPKCNAKHDQLWAGPYGILQRTCKCGEKLPTTFFNGRKKLTASCPKCDKSIESLETRPIAIPIIGAPSVGKTFFVFSLVWYIKEQFARTKGFVFKFMNSYNENNYNSEISILHRGQYLRKTVENNPIALNFFLTKNKSKSLFFFYDSAGEAFSSTQNLVQHKFYDYFNGLIFIIDPFSIPSVYAKYQSNLSGNTSIKPSITPLEDVYDALIINLEKNYKIKTTERISKPVAIVFSKVDAFDLQNIIGENAAQKILKTEETVKTIEEARREVCKAFLKNNELEALYRKIEWKFGNSQFFAVNSSGKDSIGIDKVANWLLGEIDKSYKNI